MWALQPSTGAGHCGLLVVNREVGVGPACLHGRGVLWAMGGERGSYGPPGAWEGVEAGGSLHAQGWG